MTHNDKKNKYDIILTYIHDRTSNLQIQLLIYKK